MSHFFAYLARMKLIRRWGLMRNTVTENIQEHSLQVAMIAHALAVIGNNCFEKRYNPDRVMTLAVYHDVSEVITGDLATPIKYFNPEIKRAYVNIEEIAKQRLVNMLPEELRGEFSSCFFLQEEEQEYWKLVKAADKISAYLKCVEELKTGNEEFQKAERKIKEELEKNRLPEVGYFMEKFVPSFSLTLDELN